MATNGNKGHGQKKKKNHVNFHMRYVLCILENVLCDIRSGRAMLTGYAPFNYTDDRDVTIAKILPS